MTCAETSLRTRTKAASPIRIVEAFINHTSGHLGGVARVYNKGLYSPRSQALERWGAHVAALVVGSRSNIPKANIAALNWSVAMTKASLIAETEVTVVFSDKCVRDLAATAKLRLSNSQFITFAKEVREAVLWYVQESRKPSSNQLREEIKALARAASSRQFDEVESLLANLSPTASEWLNARGIRCGWRNAYVASGIKVPPPQALYDPEQREAACAMVARLCKQGRSYLYAPDPSRNFPKRETERWFITLLSVAYCKVAGRPPARTAHGAPELTGPFARMVRKCLCLAGAREVSAVKQINTMDRLGKAARSERQKLSTLLTALHMAKQDKRWCVADLITKCEHAALSVVLIEIAGENGKVNPRVLGKWLAKHANRWCWGLRLERSHGRAGVAYWRVARQKTQVG
jgi:hypothetical protein